MSSKMSEPGIANYLVLMFFLKLVAYTSSAII